MANDTTEKPQKPEIGNPLGIDTTSLGSLKVKDLTNNKVAANMVLTYTRNCESRVAELETENETLKTYANDYETGKVKNTSVFILNLLGTIAIGFGINFLTSGNTLNNSSGWVLLIGGLILQGVGGFYLLRR